MLWRRHQRQSGPPTYLGSPFASTGAGPAGPKLPPPPSASATQPEVIRATCYSGIVLCHNPR